MRAVTGMVLVVRLEQVHRHRRHQRARQDERADHREDHRERQRHEQIARDARQEEHRHEHDADAQQRDEGGRHDLRGAVEDRLDDALALFEMIGDALDRHRPLVDQDADRETEAAQRHDVERVAGGAQEDDRKQHGERDRGRDDQRRAPRAQEEQDHQRGQHGGDHAFADDAVDRGADEQRLIADRGYLELRRQRLLERGQLALHARDDRQRRGLAVLEHGHQRRTVPVDMDDILLRRRAVADMGDVAHVDGRAVHRLDRQIVERIDRRRRVVELDIILERADLCEADRVDLVLLGDRVADVLARQALGLERLWIEIELDLALLAAERIGNGGARHRHELRPDLVLREIEQLLFGQARPRQRKLHDRHRRGVVVEDQRRRHARRQLLEDRLRDRGDLRGRRLDVGIGLEVYLHHADAVERLALDMLDVVDRRCQHALERGDDAAGHVFRRQAGILPRGRDHRHADVGEDIDRRPRGLQHADDRDQDRHHDEGQRPGKGYADDAVHRVTLSTSARTRKRLGVYRAPHTRR